MKQVLLMAYKFPPMGGVGTRRWAKFCKFLAARGHSVRVLTIRYPYLDKVSWTRDTEIPGISIHRIDPCYPVRLLRPEQDFLGKALQKAFRLMAEKKYYFIDQAQMWGAAVVPAAIEIIRTNGIRNLVATGAPFTTFFHAARVKDSIPGLNLILDYRDQWNGDPLFEVGQLFVRSEQKAVSMAMERYALARADAVVTSSDGFTRRISGMFPDCAERISTLYNGYDPDEFLQTPKPVKKEFTILYAGTLSTSPIGRWEGIECLAGAIEAADDPFISDNLRVRVFKTGTKDLKRAIGDSRFSNVFRRNFEFNDPVSPEEIARECAGSFCCLSINARGFSHAFASKVFDYMACGARLMLISERGELYDRLEEMRQYTTGYEIKEIAAVLRRLGADFQSESGTSQVDFRRYSLAERTGELENLLEE